jgi:hypothetical protein
MQKREDNAGIRSKIGTNGKVSSRDSMVFENTIATFITKWLNPAI